MRLAVLLGLVLLIGCKDFLRVSLPGVVKESSLSDPSLAPLLVNSAIGDFECAFDNFTFGSSAFSDETQSVSGQQINREWGGRLITPDHTDYVFGTCAANGFGQYTVIQTARFQAADMFNRIQAFPDSAVPRKALFLATLAAYHGYSYVMLGEQFCSMAVDGGPLMTPRQVVTRAESIFTSAITLAQSAGASADSIRYMALVGRARVRLDLGNTAGATADAQLVPVGFRKVATRDAGLSSRWNKNYWIYNQLQGFTVAPEFRGLTWKGVPDPRVTLINNGVLPQYGVVHWVTNKYMSRADPIPIATWKEAQLIIAEAQLGQTAVDIINNLHKLAGLPAYDPATDGAIMNQVIEERRRELFLEGGHRLHDLLRFNMTWKTGLDINGRPYGTTTCWPLPTVELQGNPNIKR